MSYSYNPETKMFYGPLDADHRLVPAPMISIKKDNIYSNDTIIGFTYTLDLTGYATALDLRNVSGNYDPNALPYNAGAVVDHIHKLRKILSQNGNILVVIDKDNNIMLKAKGGILKSFNIDESNNNWIHFANYTASIEFNSVEFIGAPWQTYSSEDCDDIHLKDGSYSDDQDAGTVNIQKFKIKSYSDSWSINFDENEAFNRVKKRDDNTTYLNIDNNGFNIEYTISAVGKHHFVYSNETTNASKLLPAWEQAKNFVQYRLHKQVTNLLDKVLKNTANDGCDSTENPNSAHVPGQPVNNNGLLKNIGSSKYKIFNENISCDVSESDGSFSATYTATIKNKTVSDYTTAETKHTVTKTFNITNENNIRNIGITINGTIEGLLEGGIINSSAPLKLPDSGAILIYQNNNSTKYNNAKLLLNKIFKETDYNGGFGQSGKKDLVKSFKDALGITLAALNITSAPDDPVQDPPHPVSFNLTHDYNSGTINYTVEYNSNHLPCGRKYQEISIQANNPTKIIAPFNIPLSGKGPLIQELGTQTAKTITVTINGIDLSANGKPRPMDLLSELNCNATYLPIVLPNINGILTNQEYTKNILDGSYTINLSYICNNNGCFIS